MKVSVGICARNEKETVGELIDQVMEEEIPLEEVMVVAGGDDGTVEIAKEKERRYPEVELLEEKERKGQSSAQNRIFSRISGDLLFMVDGDGLIEEGSMEMMLDRFQGGAIIHGRERPVTGDSFTGRMVDTLWRIHHRACLERPRFSTQLGLIPVEALEKLPENLIHDDIYTQYVAEQKGYETIYLPEAVKHHHTPTRLFFYFTQREKNWAGNLQLESMDASPGSRMRLYLRSYLKQLLEDFPRILPHVAVGAVEAAAFLASQTRRFTGNWPSTWRRPGDV